VQENRAEVIEKQIQRVSEWRDVRPSHNASRGTSLTVTRTVEAVPLIGEVNLWRQVYICMIQESFGYIIYQGLLSQKMAGE
jgi:hypothetical protein